MVSELTIGDYSRRQHDRTGGLVTMLSVQAATVAGGSLVSLPADRPLSQAWGLYLAAAVGAGALGVQLSRRKESPISRYQRAETARMQNLTRGLTLFEMAKDAVQEELPQYATFVIDYDRFSDRSEPEQASLLVSLLDRVIEERPEVLTQAADIENGFTARPAQPLNPPVVLKLDETPLICSLA